MILLCARPFLAGRFFLLSWLFVYEERMYAHRRSKIQDKNKGKRVPEKAAGDLLEAASRSAEEGVHVQ